jgi:hypothetical protein
MLTVLVSDAAEMRSVRPRPESSFNLDFITVLGSPAKSPHYISSVRWFVDHWIVMISWVSGECSVAGWVQTATCEDAKHGAFSGYRGRCCT